MDMKVKANIVKDNRQKKLWSQDQLAQACGLGLRTIQRIEKSGSASYESIRAIASVFEIDSDVLIYNEQEFISYKHTQIGYLMIVIMFTVVCFLFSMLFTEYQNLTHTEIATLSIISLLLLLVGIIFSSLSASVDKEMLSWHFGFKFWHKKIALDKVASCQVVKNSVLYGFGIRMMGSGWLYNVSGLLAVEIVLKSGEKIRLGTDEPEYLAQAIKSAISE